MLNTHINLQFSSYYGFMFFKVTVANTSRIWANSSQEIKTHNNLDLSTQTHIMWSHFKLL